MTTKRKECFAYSKEVGGDPVACVEGDRTGSDFYIDSAMGYANYVWRARGMCVKEVSVAPPPGTRPKGMLAMSTRLRGSPKSATST